MKKIIIMVLSLGISFSVMAQKKELKKAEKLVKSFKTGAAFQALDALKESVVGTEYEAKYYFLRGKNFFGKNVKKNYGKALVEFKKVLEIEAKSGEDDYSEKAISYIDIIEDYFFSQVTDAVKKSNYEEAGKAYERYYEIVPQRRDVLRYALLSYQEAKNNGKMIEIIQKLLNKDRAPFVYTAKNKHNKRVDEFFTKEARDLAVKYNTHENPKDEKMEAKTRVEYFNLLVRLYDQQGKNDKTIATLERAKKEFPKNAKFFQDHAAVVYKTGDKQGYLKSLDQALKLVPNNKDLWFNYGVVSQELGETEKAVTAYDKVIEIDPSYRGAYINKGLTILANEQALINELNENLRNKEKYNEIDAKIKAMYLRAIPAFEKANELKADEGIKSTLINLYKTVGQNDKAAALQ
ncbi:tetratricopeptide repeat protein [Ochrovirga pacifica]|uniref:tetratricopeptide repeat protein n=1 Tax=Ochrovirga pacifica TaxID=1042376 RepID=UPI000255801C|nr:tetratricopeptide repeat protein [Ochrovirga pacifica]